MARRKIGKWPEICAAREMLDQRAMRHMTHSGVTLWLKTTLESAQCDTVFAQNDGRIAVMAKKPAGGAV
jgi:hypothetical protein